MADSRRTMLTVLPPDLANRVRDEAEADYRTISAQIRKIVSEYYKAVDSASSTS
jgi:hypothetical protein